MESTQARFDLDSLLISVDNNASMTISNQNDQFFHGIRKLPHQHIKWISVKVNIQGKGTVKWNIEDDNGRVHALEIRDDLYVPESPLSIL